MTPMKSTTKLGVGIGAITLVTFCVWLFLWRNVHLSYDDLRASTNGGAGLYSASSPAQVWQAMAHDYFRGRWMSY